MNRRDVLAALLVAAAGRVAYAAGGLGSTDLGLDGTGQSDCSAALNACFLPGGSLHLPAGRYRVASAPLSLPDGFRLTGAPGAVLLMDMPPDRPLINIQGSRDVRVQSLRLENIHRNRVTVTLVKGQAQFDIDLPMAWNSPSLTILRQGANGAPSALQYVRDFRAVMQNGRCTIRLMPNQIRSEESELECFVQPSLAPLVGAENARNLVLSDLTCTDGALACQADDPESGDVTIEDCFLRNGQIRIGASHNTIPMFIDWARAKTEAIGASRIRILRNRLEGSIHGEDMPRYVKFTERVYGIVVAGRARKVEVTGNTVSGQSGDGIWLPSVDGGVIRDNHISRNALSGIGLENVSVLRSRNLEVSRNTVTDNWFDGCDFNYGEPSMLMARDVLGPTPGELAENVLTDNEFSGNGRDMSEVSGGCGIYVRWVRGALIERNRCTDNNLSGILVELSSNLRLLDNMLERNGRSGKPRPQVGNGIGLFGVSDLQLQANLASAAAPQLRTLSLQGWSGRTREGATAVAGNMSTGSD